MSVGQWVDERLGSAHFVRKSLDKAFPDHWSFLFGEIALFCFVVLVVTGTFMALFFDASSQPVVYNGSYRALDGVTMSSAYSSVIALSFDVRLGLMMRQMHHWAALLFVGSIVAHLGRIFFTGAFRKPREINWLIGCTLLLLALFNGFTGYSLPDDLLSGTGLRIAYSIVVSIPVIGTWMAFLLFGGQYPARATLGRLFFAHVFLVPLAIFALLSAHLAVIWRQKHTQFPGEGRREDNVVGSHFWPTYAAKSVAMGGFVAAICALLGGLVQINPVWLYGPYSPAAVTTAAQPDYYVGWLEGALRLAGPWLVRIGPYTISELFWPAIVLPGIVFTLLYAWPWIERRFTHDYAVHNLLDRPRERPVRTSIGVLALTFFIVLTLAGGQDVIADLAHVSITSVTLTLRIMVVVAPLLAGAITWKWCHDLQAADALERERAEGEPPEPPARPQSRVARGLRGLLATAFGAALLAALAAVGRALRPGRAARQRSASGARSGSTS